MMRELAVRLSVGCVAGLFVAAAPAGEAPDDRALIARTAAQREATRSEPTPGAETHGQVAPQSAGQAVSQEEATARREAALASAKLELVLARKALHQGQNDAAGQKAQSALRLLKIAQAGEEGTALELQAEGILARLGRSGDVATAGDAPGPADATTDQKVRAAARVSRSYTGAGSADIDARGDEAAIRARAEAKTTDCCKPYEPGKAIVDVDAVRDRDLQRLYYEGVLAEAYDANEARLLTEADETRITPENDVMSYPSNWPQIVKKREKWKDGVLARSPSIKDKDGTEWHVAIYDISDLMYVPPDFSGASWIGPQTLEAELNLQALRDRSQIFYGDATDLAAGIPLLRYFGGGGIDDFEYRGPKYSLEKQQEIIRMIKAFVRSPDGATIETIP